MNFNKTLRNISAVVAFGVLGVTLSPAAHAGATYSADAHVAITFTGISGGTLGQDVLVSYLNSTTQQMSTDGGLAPNPVIYPGSPAIPMEFDPMGNNELNQDQIASGTAGGSFAAASSLLQSEGFITMTNNSTSMVDFMFAYSIQAAPSVDATGNALSKDAFAESKIQFFFDKNSISADILKEFTANLTTPSPALNVSDTFTIHVAAGASDTFRVLVDTNGSASFVPDNASVPEPETLALLIAGLLLGIAVRRSVPAVSAKVIFPEQSWG